MEKHDIIKQIKEEYSKMSKGKKLLADYFINNYDKAAYMTASALSKKVGVSESTVIRFAYTLGYNGYPALQKDLQQNIKNKLTAVQRLNLMEGLSTEKIIDNVLKMDILNLKTTRENIDIPLLEKVVDSILSAKKVYIIGFRSCEPLAQFLMYYLSYILDNVINTTVGTGDIFSHLVHTSIEDVVIGLAFPRYSNQTVRGMEYARKQGSTLISITDSITSPLYQISDMTLLCKSHMNSFVDSLVAPLSIINTLIIMVGLKRKQKLIEHFTLMEDLWRSNSVYAQTDYSGEGRDE